GRVIVPTMSRLLSYCAAFVVGACLMAACASGMPGMYPSVPSASGSSMRVAQASPARGRAAARCHEAVIRLPGAIALHGDGGTVSGSVETNLTPGDYGIRYSPRTRRF